MLLGWEFPPINDWAKFNANSFVHGLERQVMAGSFETPTSIVSSALYIININISNIVYRKYFVYNQN